MMRVDDGPFPFQVREGLFNSFDPSTNSRTLVSDWRLQKKILEWPHGSRKC